MGNFPTTTFQNNYCRIPPFCASPCSAGPCQNGGTCKNSSDFSLYICVCSSGYFGTNCENATSDGLDDVITELTARGIDNSDKQLSITLVNQTSCDLDLYAEQPDGTEINYRKKGPLPSTGRMDHDTEYQCWCVGYMCFVCVYKTVYSEIRLTHDLCNSRTLSINRILQIFFCQRKINNSAKNMFKLLKSNII